MRVYGTVRSIVKTAVKVKKASAAGTWMSDLAELKAFTTVAPSAIAMNARTPCNMRRMRTGLMYIMVI